MAIKQVALFGAGCFWGVQSEFDKVEGVLKTEVGYMGGDEGAKEISYEEVCTGLTGHVEVVKVTFDSSKVEYIKLLDLFWEIHNPTTLNRQGLDIGTQYKSVIFYIDSEQKSKAMKSLKERQRKLGKKKIVTEIVKVQKFYMAEDYHQKYNEKHGRVC
jgi:peptide-methionine (S)-S-oxide reductase